MWPEESCPGRGRAGGSREKTQMGLLTPVIKEIFYIM